MRIDSRISLMRGIITIMKKDPVVKFVHYAVNGMEIHLITNVSFCEELVI